MLLGQGLRLAAWGLGPGVVLAFGLTFSLSKIRIPGIEPADVWSYAAVLALILGATFSASLVPARRAARVEPMEALRCD